VVEEDEEGGGSVSTYGSKRRTDFGKKFDEILVTAQREVNTNAVWFWMSLKERERVLALAYGRNWSIKKAKDIERYNLMMQVHK